MVPAMTELLSSPLLEPTMVVASQPIPLDKKDTLRHLEKTNPETLALAYDWGDIADKVVHTQEKIKQCVMDFYACLAI